MLSLIATVYIERQTLCFEDNPRHMLTGWEAYAHDSIKVHPVSVVYKITSWSTYLISHTSDAVEWSMIKYLELLRHHVSISGQSNKKTSKVPNIPICITSR